MILNIYIYTIYKRLFDWVIIDWLIFGRVSADRPADHKEAFNITEPCNEQRVSWIFQRLNNLLSLEFYFFVRI